LQSGARQPPPIRNEGGRRVRWQWILSVLLLATSTAFAQQIAKPRVAWVLIGSEANSARWVAAFKDGLRELGFEDRRNVTLDLRYAEGNLERYPVLFQELAQTPADVFMAAGEQGIRAAQVAAAGRPVLAFFCGNLVEDMVQSFARPGNNTTGVACFSDELTIKRVQLLHDALPTVRRIAYFYNPNVSGKEREKSNVQSAGRALGLAVDAVQVNRVEAIAPAFLEMAATGIQGAVVAEDLFALGNRAAIVAASTTYGVPGVFALREFVEAGGFLSYGPRLPERFQQWGRYCGRILKGSKPEELPINQPTSFELVINRRAAQQAGIGVSERMFAMADEIVE
jgi:putative tryptophan/tyrosine transport system substrate-binding protein